MRSGSTNKLIGGVEISSIIKEAQEFVKNDSDKEQLIYRKRIGKVAEISPNRIPIYSYKKR
ncbi:hypothetical protein AAGG74_16270 [Bacillus mexicanus]|uniref:hypothetical protein n=1 Tax=Bacillus mexicanus TaxID=2834415 RepID=UPI003D1AA0B9